MHIEDYVSGALHAYADEWLAAAPQVQLELHAMAHHLGAYLAEGLGLKQEWAVGAYNQHGNLDDIDDECEDRQVVVRCLEIQQGLDKGEGTGEVPRVLMTRLYTDWADDPEPILDDELLDLVEADGEPCQQPDACNWFAAGDEYVCSACGKAELKEAGPVVFQDQ